MLRLIADFIHKRLFLSEAESTVLRRRQSLRNTVLESLNAALNESVMKRIIHGMNCNCKNPYEEFTAFEMLGVVKH